MAKIYYNGKNPFDGISTIPLISRASTQIYKNDIEGISQSIVLYGRIKYDNICSPKEYVLDSEGNRISDGLGGYQTTARTFSSALEAFLFARQKIIDSFSTNFKKLEVFDNNGSLVFEGKHCLIRSITFDEDRYYNLIPYSISIDIFSGSYADLGILDPSDSWSFDDAGNSTASVTHQASCKSINTDDLSIENAKTFLESKQGIFPIYSTLFKSLTHFFLRSKRMSINRFTGECSLVENYICDNGNYAPSSAGILIYISDVKYSGKTVSVSISGKIISDMNIDMDSLRQILVSQDWLALATEAYTEGGLSEKPVEYSIKEDLDKREITFSISFSNQLVSGPYVIDSTTISENKEDNSYCVKFRGVIKNDAGCKYTRFEEIKSYYDTLDIEYLFSQKYAEFGSGIKLSTTTKSRSYSENKFEPSIAFEVTYCNVKGEACGCFDLLDYSMKFNPAIPKYAAAPTLNGLGCYYVQELGYDRRATFSISGSAIVSDCCSYAKALDELKTRINTVMNKYFAATERVLDALQINKTPNGKTILFEASWSGFQACPLPENLKTC